MYKVIAATKSYHAFSAALWLSTTNDGRWLPAQDENFSLSLGRIANLLKQDSSAGLLVCGCAASSPDVKRLFGLQFLPSWIRLKPRPNHRPISPASQDDYTYFSDDAHAAALRFLLSCIIDVFWDLTDGERILLRILEQHPVLPPPQHTFRLPLQLANMRLNCSGIELPTKRSLLRSDISKSNDNEASRLPESWSETIFLRLRWKREAPVYSNGLHFFTFQPFDRRPRLDSLQLLITQGRTHAQRRAFFVASSPNLLARLNKALASSQICDKTVVSTDTQICMMVLSMCDCLFSDSLEYLSQSLLESERIVFRPATFGIFDSNPH